MDPFSMTQSLPAKGLEPSFCPVQVRSQLNKTGVTSLERTLESRIAVQVFHDSGTRQGIRAMRGTVRGGKEEGGARCKTHKALTLDQPGILKYSCIFHLRTHFNHTLSVPTLPTTNQVHKTRHSTCEGAPPFHQSWGQGTAWGWKSLEVKMEVLEPSGLSSRPWEGDQDAALVVRF